jgi:hypothetical protein
VIRYKVGVHIGQKLCTANWSLSLLGEYGETKDVPLNQRKRLLEQGSYVAFSLVLDIVVSETFQRQLMSMFDVALDEVLGLNDRLSQTFSNCHTS